MTHIGWIVETAQADAHCRSEAGQGGQKYAEEERVNKYKQMYKYKYKYKLKQMLAAALKPVKADKNMLKSEQVQRLAAKLILQTIRYIENYPIQYTQQIQKVASQVNW